MSLESLRLLGFDIAFTSHAEAVVSADFPDVLGILEVALSEIHLPISEIIGSGGGEALITQRLRRTFYDCGWKKRNVVIEKVVDGEARESTSHEIDHWHVAKKGTFALEIEWNNKDPFFDRDLENFKRLHAEGIVSVACIITRGESLQAEMLSMIERWAVEKSVRTFEDLKTLGFKRPTERQESIVSEHVSKGQQFSAAWSKMFYKDKYGTATTHWEKLNLRLARGVGNPCPLLLIGLPAKIVDESQ